MHSVLWRWGVLIMVLCRAPGCCFKSTLGVVSQHEDAQGLQGRSGPGWTVSPPSAPAHLMSPFGGNSFHFFLPNIWSSTGGDEFGGREGVSCCDHDDDDGVYQALRVGPRSDAGLNLTAAAHQHCDTPPPPTNPAGLAALPKTTGTAATRKQRC